MGRAFRDAPKACKIRVFKQLPPGVCRNQVRQTPDAKPAPEKSQKRITNMQVHPCLSSHAASAGGFPAEGSAGFAFSSLTHG
jgi:hypothetical protein